MLALDPGVIAVLALLSTLYIRAVAVLRRRGRRVRKRQQAAWWIGMVMVASGLLSGIDVWAEDLLSAHMAQHLLVAELGVPLMLLGLRSPVLLFMLPKPALKRVARLRRTRKVLTKLSHPLVAVPLYTLVLYAWHFRALFEGALRSELVHGLQHQSFVLISVLVWWSALEPGRMRMRGELWKAGHIFAARLGGMFLGMGFIVMRSPAYESFYGDRSRDYGLTPIYDQQLAGGMMLSLDVVIIMAALCFFFWRASEDDYERQRAEAANLQSAQLEQVK